MGMPSLLEIGAGSLSRVLLCRIVKSVYFEPRQLMLSVSSIQLFSDGAGCPDLYQHLSIAAVRDHMQCTSRYIVCVLCVVCRRSDAVSGQSGTASQRKPPATTSNKRRKSKNALCVKKLAHHSVSVSSSEGRGSALDREKNCQGIATRRGSPWKETRARHVTRHCAWNIVPPARLCFPGCLHPASHKDTEAIFVNLTLQRMSLDCDRSFINAVTESQEANRHSPSSVQRGAQILPCMGDAPHLPSPVTRIRPTSIVRYLDRMPTEPSP